LGQAGVKSAHGVTVRVGMAKEDFEGVVVVNGLHNGFTDLNGLGLRRAIIHVGIDESAFVRVSAIESVGDFGQAGVKSAHGVTVRVPQGDNMGVAEENFEGAFVSGGHGFPQFYLCSQLSHFSFNSSRRTSSVTLP
jgi:hypothetical protein